MPEINIKGAHLPILLKKLESQTYTGELLFCNEAMNAKIYIFGGKIFWAFAAGQKNSLQSILIREYNKAPETVTDSIRSLRAQGKKDITLVIKLLGIPQTEEQSSIVKRHIVGAFGAILNWPNCRAILRPMKHSEHSFEYSVDDILLSADDEMRESQSYPHLPEKDSSQDLNLHNFDLSNICGRIPGLVSLSIIDIVSGMPISYFPEGDNSEADLTSAYFRNIFNSASDLWTDLLMDTGGSELLMGLVLNTKSGQVAMSLVEESGYMICLIMRGEADSKSALRKVVQEIKTYLN